MPDSHARALADGLPPAQAADVLRRLAAYHSGMARALEVRAAGLEEDVRLRAAARVRQARRRRAILAAWDGIDARLRAGEPLERAVAAVARDAGRDPAFALEAWRLVERRNARAKRARRDAEIMRLWRTGHDAAAIAARVGLAARTVRRIVRDVLAADAGALAAPARPGRPASRSVGGARQLPAAGAWRAAAE